MKRFIIGLLVLCGGTASSQIYNPVQWSYSAKKISDKTYELHFTASISNRWHLYSQEAGEGPVPTKFTFAGNPLVTIDGKIREIGNLEKSYDKNFNSVLKYYANSVEFIQKIKVRQRITTAVKGSINFMVCNDRECLPPRDFPFTIKIGEK